MHLPAHLLQFFSIGIIIWNPNLNLSFYFTVIVPKLTFFRVILNKIRSIFSLFFVEFFLQTAVNIRIKNEWWARGRKHNWLQNFQRQGIVQLGSICLRWLINILNFHIVSNQNCFLNEKGAISCKMDGVRRWRFYVGTHEKSLQFEGPRSRIHVKKKSKDKR